MMDSTTCHANAAETAAFAATISDSEVKLFWEQTAQHWTEKAALAELQEQGSRKPAKRKASVAMERLFGAGKPKAARFREYR
jgi:hypothetical protein